MRRKIRRMEKFHQGVEYLLRQGVVPRMDRIRFEERDDGFVISFEGSFGSNGPRHEAKFTTTKSGRELPEFQSLGRGLIV